MAGRRAREPRRPRIFTPGGELPFAGHPTVGAALASSTPAGPRSVETVDPEDASRCLGLELGDLHPSMGSRAWSAGVPFTVVALRDVRTLERITIDLGWWRDTMAFSDAPAIYAVAPLDGVGGRRWRARTFAPHLGIIEDPATGSAATVGGRAVRVGRGELYL